MLLSHVPNGTGAGGRVAAGSIHPWEISWDTLVSILTGPPVVAEDKFRVPLWSPSERDPAATDGSDRWVIQNHLAVLDVDDSPMSMLSTILGRIQALGLEAVFHSSHGSAEVYPKGRTKFRVVIPLAAPVPARLWPTAWKKVFAAITPEGDGQCKNVGRNYFLPSCPPNAPEGSVWSFHIPGKALDLGTLPEPSILPLPTRKITREELIDLSKAWKRSKDRKTKLRGQALALVTKGEPYADHGSRDVTTWDLISGIVQAIPDGEHKSISEHFTPSLSLMGPDAPTVESIRDKAARAHRFLEEAAAPAPIVRSNETHLLVSSVGSAYYLKKNGDWLGPYQGDAVDPAITRHLADVEGVQVFRAKEDGSRYRRPRQEILEECGDTIREHVFSMGGTKTTWEEKTGTLTEACATLRPLRPEYSPIVDDFLRTLSPPRYRQILTWMAVATNTAEPLAALTLIGKRGSGKSLLANGMARLWSETGPCPAKEAFADWNADILRCPLVFADEYLPGDRKVMTGRLREFVQARTHAIRRKYLPGATARGCARLVIAANSIEILAFDEHLSREDLLAVAERFFIVRVDDEAIRQWHAKNPGAAAEMDQGEAIARHALWLRDNLYLKRECRFWIAGNDQEVDAMAVRGGLRADLCRWIVEWLRSPGRLSQVPGSSGVRSQCTPIGEILISLSEIHGSWNVYVDTPRPTVSALRQALLVIAPKALKYYSGERGNWLQIDPKLLTIWLDATGWDDCTVGDLIQKWESQQKMRIDRRLSN